MSAPSIPGSVATHEDILRLEKRMERLEKRMDEQILHLEKRMGEQILHLEKRMDEALARLDERVAAIMRMQNWNFALLVLVLGALLARIVS